MIYQFMPNIFHDPRKNPQASPPTYLMYGPILQIEWQLQNGPTTTSRVLPVTLLFFWKVFSSFRIS